MEKMLKYMEYKTLVEQAPIMIWRSNLKGECDYFNRRWLEFSGRSIVQELGNGWTEGVHPEDLQECLQTYLVAFSERRVFEMEYRLRRKDGEYRWILDRGVPFFDDIGEFAGFIGSCIDVTERYKTQRSIDKGIA